MDSNTCNPIQFLSASAGRLEILEYLRENPSDPRDIADSISKSHRCIQRDLSAFESRGWIEKTNGVYQLTTHGAAITTQYADGMNAISLIDRYESLFRHLPDSDHLPDPRWLRDASVAIADQHRPHAPLDRYVDGIRECETEVIRVITPVCGRSFSDAHAELLERGVETELIVDAATPKTACLVHSEEFPDTLVPGMFDRYECSDRVEFGLTIAEDCGFLRVYDERSQLVACAESTDPVFLDWADDLYERYRERSEPIGLEDTIADRDSSPE